MKVLQLNMLAIFCLLLIGVVSSANIKPCNIEDSSCITEIARIVYTKAVVGVPELGIDIGDPLHMDVLKADLSTIKFEITDATTKGFKDCDIKKVIINKTPEKSTMNIDMHCSNLAMNGKYEIDGHLGEIPIQGKGDFEIDTKDYSINVQADIKYTNKDGKRYISIVNPKIDAELMGDLYFVMHNLFNGDAEKADPVNKFIKENPKQTVKLLDGPVFEKNFGKLFDGFNKQLQVIPVDNLIA